MDCGFLNKEGWFRYRAAAIIIENGYVLLAKNDTEPYYYSVGGGVKQNETAEDAVVREVLEETGARYEVDRLAFIHENFFMGSQSLKGVPCHEVAFYFLMKPRGLTEFSAKSATSNGENERVYWLKIDELQSYYAYPTWFASELKTLSAGIKHIVTKEY